MLDITKPFVWALEQRHLHYSYAEIKSEPGNQREMVTVSLQGKVVKSVALHFIFNKNGNSVALRVFDLAPRSIPEEKMDKMLRLINDLNEEYIFAKFCISTQPSGKRNLEMQMAAIVLEDFSGFVCYQLMTRAISTCDAVYQRLLSALNDG